VPVAELAVASTRAWLAAHLHALDADRQVRVHCLIRPGSRDLVDLFERQRHGAPRLANDTSMGIGFAPFTPLEQAVLAAERRLQDRADPARGEDVKVMGVRIGGRSDLTVACAFIGRHLPDLDAYLDARRRAAETARAEAATTLGSDVAVAINTADGPDAGSVYLTVTGTSAEAGDDGQTGRGNRANGVITPSRPMTLESIAGKNPITHVGKLYNVVAMQIAGAVVAEIEAVREAHVLVVSRIGAPIEEPQVVHLRLRTDTPVPPAEMQSRAQAIARRHMAGVGALWTELLTRNLATGGEAPP
jgi:S-adenosylmethionine synthetase